MKYYVNDENKKLDYNWIKHNNFFFITLRLKEISLDKEQF